METKNVKIQKLRDAIKQLSAEDLRALVWAIGDICADAYNAGGGTDQAWAEASFRMKGAAQYIS